MGRRTALIVGAGIGGLAAAIALERSGWQVRVFERASNPRELGFALNLAPNAIAALRELGLAERLIAEGHIPAAVELRRANGRVLKRLNIPSAMGQTPSLVALRPVLHGALLNAINPESLILSSEAVGFEATSTDVAVRFADGRSETGNVLIGADGIHSIVRRLLHPHEAPLPRSRYVGIRGVAQGAEHILGSLSAVAYFGHGIEAAVTRAGREAVYWYISLLAEDVPIETRQPHVIVERCAAILDDDFRAIVQATRPEDVRLDELSDRDPIADWGRGRVTLLGDAAHPMLPHTGQGAAQALEDAVAVGLALAPDRDPMTALRLYERVRSARTRHIVRRGRISARIMTTRSRTIDWLRAAGLRLMPTGPIVRSYMLAGKPDPHRLLRSTSTAR